ncbi:MAG: bifunctional folylpolyglutamate synthase/dihydrofolate synthase [Anaerotardibacter sp.]
MNSAQFDPVSYINTPRWLKVSLGLHRTQELMEKLGNPQDSLRFVHVAGTNGKGSTCAFTAQILQEAGYKVGLFTSPYIVCFEERIRINGKNIPADRLAQVTWRVREIAEAMDEHPTEFELMTAVAFRYFYEEQCDVVVAEVGLGGRLDSTNIIAPLVCGIAPIALDHCALLGETLAEIASEKAGIIKAGIPVVSSVQEDEAQRVIVAKAQESQAPYSQIRCEAIEGTPADFSYVSRRGVAYNHLALSLRGTYQTINAALAIELAETINAQADLGLPVSTEAIVAGLQNTSWPGRFELVCDEPLIYIDGGHNMQGAQALVDSLHQYHKDKKVTFIFGVLEDKKHEQMAEILLPLAEEFWCFTPPSPRALSAKDLAEEIESLIQTRSSLGENEEGSSAKVRIFPSISKAVANLSQTNNEDKVFCFCGSLYSIGEIKQNLASLGYTLPL